MVFVRALLPALLALVLVVLSQLVESCPPAGRDEDVNFRKEVITATCDHTRMELENFKNETRLRHNVTEKRKYFVCIYISYPLCMTRYVYMYTVRIP